MNAALNQAQEPNPFEQSFSTVPASNFKHYSPPVDPTKILSATNGGNDNNVDIWISDTSSYTFDSNSINNDSYAVSDHQASSNSTSEDSSSSNSDDMFIQNNNPIVYEFEQQQPKRHSNTINYGPQAAQEQYQYQAQFIKNNGSSNTTKRQNKGGNKKRTRTVKLPEDEEKRKNFLERNRLAALKCRQRKKQWFSNLRARVEYLTNDNDHLQMETDTLRKEIMDLNTLLVAHKDCPQYNAALSASSMHQQQHHQLQHPSLYHSSLRF